MTKIVLRIFIVLIVAHCMWSGLVAYGFERLYVHRVMNVRKLSVSDREPMAHAFWQAHIRANSDKPTVVFLGSSTTYGYAWQESVIFSRKFADHASSWKVVNLSVIGVGMTGIRDYLLCPLLAAIDRKPEILIVEIPIVNTTAEFVRKGDVLQQPRKCDGVISHGLDYFRFVIERPRGTNWIPLIWDEYAYDKLDEKIALPPMGLDYFASAVKFANVEKQYRKELHDFFVQISSLGQKIVVFISPIYLAGVDQVGGDRAAVEYQTEVTLQVCRTHPLIQCLSVSEFGENPNAFSNVTHLNQSGHHAFGEWLAKQVLSTH